MGKPVLKDMTVEEMRTLFISMEEKPFRAEQVFEWIYKGASTVEEMRNLPAALKRKLEDTIEFENIKTVCVQKSAKDGTRKYLFEMPDGEKVEAVLMKYSYGNSICISSQAGCNMGCKFCASAIGGLKRNLYAWEMVAQVLMASKEAEEKIGHVVIMGTGEPFNNYDNVAKFINLINSPKGLNMSRRNITVSTCGIVDKINRFAQEFPQVTLAISLHAPTDDIRADIMPVNKKFSVDEVIKAGKDYGEKTGRRVTYEYALIEGINDRIECADVLAQKLSNSLSHVNLIPLNSVMETGLKGVSRVQAKRFKERLEEKGINATIRRELGEDIDAACGQLRNK